MHFELNTFDSRTLPAVTDLNGVPCRVLNGGLLADPVDVPELPGLFASGYAVLVLLGTRGDARTTEELYAMSGFYRADETGRFELLGVPWTGTPRASGDVKSGTLRLRLTGHPRLFPDGVEMTFQQGTHAEVTSMWRATVASQWPRTDSRDAHEETVSESRRAERAWSSPLLREV